MIPRSIASIGHLRWSPIWPIAFSCGLFILSLIWPPALDGVSLGRRHRRHRGIYGQHRGDGAGIHMHGPLGKPSLEDDEREAALRKDSFLFCLGLLACSQLPGPTLPHDPVSFAELANRAECERRNGGLHAECHLVRMFADTLCELEIAAIAERMIAPGTCDSSTGCIRLLQEVVSRGLGGLLFSMSARMGTPWRQSTVADLQRSA